MAHGLVETVPIAAFISAKNEASNIEQCIESLSGLVERIVVIDSCSIDETAMLAERAGAEVVVFSWNGSYPKKKEWCLENVAHQGEWVFFVDADERPDAKLLLEIRRLINDVPSLAGIITPIRYVFGGRVLRFGVAIEKVTVVRAGLVSFPDTGDIDAPGMGELEGHYQPVVDGAVQRTKSRLRHHDVDSFSSWIARHNSYSDWEAWVADHPVVQSRIRRLKSRQGRAFDRVPFKPGVYFVFAYIMRLGFLDGRAGLDYAIALSFYRWQIGVKLRERRQPSGLDR